MSKDWLHLRQHQAINEATLFPHSGWETCSSLNHTDQIVVKEGSWDWEGSERGHLEGVGEEGVIDMSHVNLFSGWSRGPGYTSPQHRLILGLRVAILRPACSSTGTETEKGQELCTPPCAHFVLISSVPYAHFHVFIPAYSRPVYSTLQCVCPFPPTPVITL